MQVAAQLDIFDSMSMATGLECEDPSKAIQSQSQEADINYIVRQFGLTGQLPSSFRIPLQEDFVDIVSYQEAQNAILEANASFMRVPPAIRARFDNDAGAFVDFCSDPANLDELRRLGLAPAAAAPVEPVVVPPAT